jgi:outer membrane protein assembly factor BamB
VDAFSSAPELDAVSNGGIWGSAGPAIDDDGDVYVTTGNAPPGSEDATNVWGNSLLRFDARLRLLGSYTPFNYCRLDAADLDLAGSQPILLPTLNGTTTPDTVAFGSKQGNVYLVDREALRTSDRRPPCSLDSTADASLVPPGPQPQFDARGPLNVFGPYSEIYGMIDQAKMRSKLAYFEDRDGARWLFATGSTKAAPASTQSVAPSIAKLRITTPAGGAAYLELEATNADVVFSNPGSPIVTSRGPDDAVVWVVDRNAARTSSTSSPDTPRPILYAFDATTLALLWRTPDDMLGPAGKYATPAATHGVVFIGTDRVQAFGTRR